MVVILSGRERGPVGKRLAEALGWRFVDGEDSGKLDRLRESIRGWLAERKNVVVACATRVSQRLAVHDSVRFLHLIGAEVTGEWGRGVPVIDVEQPIDAVVDAARTFISI